MREDELPELEQHLSESCVTDVKGGAENEYGKVNILLQAYISKAAVESFSLISDMSYVAQVGMFPAMKFLRVSELIAFSLWSITVFPL